MNASTLARILSAPFRHAPLLLVAVTLALAYGIWYAYSVFLVALLEEFAWPRSVLAGAFSVFAIVHGFSNPLVGMLCDRVRPSILLGIGGIGIGLGLWFTSTISTPLQLYIGFGGFTALSVALCGWVPAVVLVQRRYIHRLGFALGIVSAGVGVGMLIVVPICQLLIDQIGWRSAYQVLGASCTLFMVPTAVYLFLKSKAASALAERTKGSQLPTTEVSITPKQAFAMPAFWLLFAAFLFGSICSQTLHVHQVAFLVDHGLEAIIGASVVSVVGFASVVAKIGGGWLSDKIAREIIFMVSSCILLASIAMLLWVGAHPTLWGAYVFGALLGVGYSAVAAITPAMVSDRFSGKHYGTILGIGLLGSALGSAFGPWMAGALFDHTGSYTLPFLLAGLSGVITLIAAALVYRLRTRDTASATF